jgi:hypothetical protein
MQQAPAANGVITGLVFGTEDFRSEVEALRFDYDTWL